MGQGILPQIVYVGLTVLFLFASGCGLETTEDGADGSDVFAPVFVLETEHLEAPAVGAKRVYKPAFFFDGNRENPDVGRPAGFFLTVAAGDPETLKIRLVQHPNGTVSRLERVSPQLPSGESFFDGGSIPFHSQAGRWIASGRGVFWVLEPDESDDALTHRVAVVVPEVLLRTSVRLEIYSVEASDGSPIGADRIELVRDFFYLVVIGDSIQWGNGLKEEDKISALVSAVIERETQRKVIMQRYAHSGAKIVPAQGDSFCLFNCNGEVPTESTSITAQVDRIERTDLVDLVLMDGCINDVGVAAIIDAGVPQEELLERTHQFCEEEMTTLLQKIVGMVPQAPIVVTGYFQIVGPQSDLFAMRQWSSMQGAEMVEEDSEPVAILTTRSVAFHQESKRALAAAVARANRTHGATGRIAFVDPQFGPEHAVFTPDRWLWSMTADNEFLEALGILLALFPEDPMQRFRSAACFDLGQLDRLLPCFYASVGHPNPAGARAYADPIVRALREFDVLPATPLP